MSENILFICAHSDDHIIGAGGTIARYIEEGKKVHVLILSYGEKTHPWLKANVTKTMRAEETYNADSIIGCTSAFFDLKEGHFREQFNTIKDKVMTIIEKSKPVKIFTHNNEDPHPDHRACYTLVTGLLNSLKYNPELYLFSIWNPFSFHKGHLPRMYVDITPTHHKKMEALKHFKSQWGALTLLIGGIFAREVKNGLHIGTRFAERFYRLK